MNASSNPFCPTAALCEEPGAPVRLCGRGWMVVILLMALALLLRLYRLDVSFTTDEVLTLRGAQLRIPEILVHRFHPLYYLLAHFALLLGDSEGFLRLPSVLAGVLCVPAAYALARDAAGGSVGLLAAFLTATSQYNIGQSQSARFYAVVMLGGLLLSWFVHRGVTRGGYLNWAGVVCTGWWLTITQLTALPYYGAIFAGAGLWLLFTRNIPGAHAKARKLGLLMLCALLGLLTLAAIVAARGRPTVLNVDPFPKSGSEVATDSKGNTYDYQLYPGQYVQFLSVFLPQAGLLIQVLVVGAMCVGFAVLWRRLRCLATIVAAQFMLPPLPFLFLPSSHWYAAKYFCNVAPLFVILTSIGIWAVIESALTRIGGAERRVTSRALVLAILMLALTPGIVWQLSSYYERCSPVDWRGVGSYLGTRLAPGDVIAYTDLERMSSRLSPDAEPVFPRSSVAFDYYLVQGAKSRRTDEAPIDFLKSIQKYEAGTAERIKRMRRRFASQRVWCIGVNEKDLEPSVQDALNALPVAETVTFEGCTVRQVLYREKP
ncbi:MAG: glycosyltransferase family 39 protein [Candidatus Hydrogenedentes bacterium]|nr:glycosyltransferase family 39 protein [Candidatus Hydrogenedentota bacterium]